MKKTVMSSIAIILCVLSLGAAATVTPQLRVEFNGTLSGSNYVSADGEVVQGALQLKQGTEALSEGVLITSDVSDGIHFEPDVSLTHKVVRDQYVIDQNFVIEMVARRNDVPYAFQTLFSVHGSVAYRYTSSSSAETEFMTYGPQSTGWRTVSGSAALISDSELLHYALVYEYVSDTQCKLSCYVEGEQVDSTLVNSTAAEGQPDWGIMFGGDSHTSATERGMPLDIDAVAFSTYTGTFDSERDFSLLSSFRLVFDTGDGLSVQEGQGMDQYKISLSREPQGEVTIELQDISDPPMVQVSPKKRTFNSNSWDRSYTVYVIPIAGQIDPGVHTTTIRHAISSDLDPDYNAVADVDLSVTVYDEDYDEADELARPTAEQILWHDYEVGMFIHYSINTYLDMEWDTGASMDNLALFDPQALDVNEWVEAAQAMGAGYVVFVAKHVGGFCMWQTDTTEYSIKNTPYQDGQGDVLADLVAACQSHHMPLGVYLSPQDRFHGAGVGGNTFDATDQDDYDALYRAQLTEILRDYDPFMEVWFDGNIVTQINDILAQYAPDAMIFQCPGGATTIRWVGNEDGYCPYPAWNAVPQAIADAGTGTAANSDPAGEAWVPLECDARTRNTWFWRTDNAASLKSVDSLMSMYYNCVGHGAVLLLNMTPDLTGAFPQQDVQRVTEFGLEVKRRFATPIASTYGTGDQVILELSEPNTINHVVLMEDIAQGERVREYAVDGLVQGTWQTLCEGTAIGHKKIDTFDSVENVSQVRFRSVSSVGTPIIRQLAVYDTDVSTYTPEEYPFEVVDQWYPGHLATGPNDATWDIDVTTYVQDAAQYEIVFEKTSGTGDIDIQSVVLVIDSVEQPEWTEPCDDENQYRITIPGLGSSMIIRVQVQGVLDDRSYGQVKWRRAL